jgi:hypothetical protein
MNMRQENRFLAMWDNQGLECLFDITDLDGDNFMSALKGETYKTPFNIGTMIIRARANSQRSYEIYAFTTDETMDYDFVKDMFESDPQVIVNSIRETGRKIYSDYTPNTKKVIA